MKEKKIKSVQFAKALADSTRQNIMNMLCCAEMSVGEIAVKAGIKQPTATHHLSILKEMELVIVRIEGKNSIYTLDQERFVSCCGSLIEKFNPDSELIIQIKPIENKEE